ncbi:MAG: LL-diaminopimelate aminotransferase [Christensenellales bacterium]|jgi:LL-diaminopimelate aminotransferase
MVKFNSNYKNLKPSYLFSDVAARVREYTQKTGNKVITMGIGDVTQPLCAPVVDALVKASKEMGQASTFRGYGPEQGYEFLRQAVADYYAKIGVSLANDEVFISDGAKSDLANITDLFDNENIIALPDPVYPVYFDSNLMLGRKVRLMQGNRENGFLPMPDNIDKVDIVYLCSPNNPTGAVYSKEQLKQWVDYALANGALIMFDAAYEAFITDGAYPRSIYEIEGAKKCAVEFCSLSKTAGFTGVRCGYTVVPHDIVSNSQSLNKMWLRRQTTKFNGVPYVVQRAAEAVFTPEGIAATGAIIQKYLQNGNLIARSFDEIGIWYTGGKYSPYIWFACPKGMASWEFFDILLNQVSVVGTPGSGFGKCGEGYMRLTAFNTYENTAEAMQRIKELVKSL